MKGNKAIAYVAMEPAVLLSAILYFSRVGCTSKRDEPSTTLSAYLTGIFLCFVPQTADS
jgi:hypothetical protein